MHFYCFSVSHFELKMADIWVIYWPLTCRIKFYAIHVKILGTHLRKLDILCFLKFWMSAILNSRWPIYLHKITGCP